MRSITLRYLLIVATVLGLCVGNLATLPSQAQILNTAQWANGEDVGAYALGVAPTTYYPIIIKYIGQSGTGGTVAVSAGGDITLKTGPVGSSTADATTECPFLTPNAGVIDVSDAACNTLGEVVDAINASPNWRAVIQDGLRSDSSNDTLYDLTETAAAGPLGVALAADGAGADQITLALTPVRNDIRWYLQESGPTNAGVATNPQSGLNKNPFNDSRTFFRYATSYIDGTGSGAATVYSVLGNYVVPPQSSAVTATTGLISASTETVTTLFVGAGAADETLATFTLFSSFGLGGRRGEKVLFRIADAALAGATSAASASGRFEKRTQ